MRKIFSFLAVSTTLVTVPSTTCQAYEVGTHAIMSRHSVTKSRLWQDPNLLKGLGLPATTLKAYKGSDGTRRTLLQTIVFGSIHEDDASINGFRFLNHFFDVQHNNYAGRPLTVYSVQLGHTSPDWILEDRGNVKSLKTTRAPVPLVLQQDGGRPQFFSYKDANRYFAVSISAGSPDKRLEHAGLMFQTLGHVIHHIQDMGQPQHSRNGAHTFAPSNWREKYTSRFFNEKIPALLESSPYPQPGTHTNIPFIDFASPRHFWHTPNNNPSFVGMTEFTAHNFISTGMFNSDSLLTRIHSQRFAAHPDFSLPDGKDVEEAIHNTTIRLANGNFKNGDMKLLVRRVFDGYTSSYSQKEIPLAQLSILSAHIEPQAPGNHLLSIPSVVFKSQYPILLPRAAAFSTGLLDYFFRGEITISRGSSPNQWTISNLGKHNLNGIFTVYAEDNAGIRRKISGAEYSLRLHGTRINGRNSATVTFQEPPTSTRKLAVLFRGEVGGVGNASGEDNYSVAAKVVSYSPPAIPCGTPISARGGSETRTELLDLGSESGTVQVRFEAYSIPDQLEVFRGPSSSRAVSSGGLVSGYHVYEFKYDPKSFGGRIARLVVKGNNDKNTLWAVNMGCPGDKAADTRKTVTFGIGGGYSDSDRYCSLDLYLNGKFATALSGAGRSFSTRSVKLSPGQHYYQYKNIQCNNPPGFTSAHHIDVWYQDSNGKHGMSSPLNPKPGHINTR